MAISQFPAPATGGGGGAGLPIGATALEFGGKLTGAGYSHPGTLTAGKYIIECDNTVKVTLGDNAQEFFVEPGETIDLAVDESNFFVEPKAVLAGPPAVVETYPNPHVADNMSYTRNGTFHINETTGAGAYIGGQYNSTSNTHGWYRSLDTGAYYTMRSGTSVSNISYNGQPWEMAIIATNVDGETLIFSKVNSSNVYVYRHNANTSVMGISQYSNSVLTNFPTNGFAGAAISADGQTIVVPYSGSANALVSTDGGATFTDVSIGVTAKDENFYDSIAIWWVHDRFILSTSTAGQFAHSTDGTTWTQVAMAGSSGFVCKPARSATGKWLFSTKTSNNTMWETTDLTSFSAITVTPAAGNYPWDGGISYADGKFIATNVSYGYPNHSVSEDDGATWFDISNDLTLGNTLAGTNLWYFNSTLRYQSFASSMYWGQMSWDALWNKWIQASAPYWTSNNAYWWSPFMTVDSSTYLRWMWGVNNNEPLPTTPLLDDVGNKIYYTGYHSDLTRSNRVVEYDLTTGQFRTLPHGFNGNTDQFSQTGVSSIAGLRMQEPDATGATEQYLHVTMNGIFRSEDLSSLIPTFSQYVTYTSAYPGRVFQWPDGSINVFNYGNSTTYIDNVYMRKFNNGPTSIGISFGVWNWGGNTSDYEDNVFSWTSNLGWAPFVDPNNKTFSAAYSNYAMFDVGYPVTSANQNANQYNGLANMGGDGENKFQWKYYTQDQGVYKTGLNKTGNNGSSWLDISGFTQYYYTYATRVIDGTAYFIVKQNIGNLFGVFRVNDFASGDYEELFTIGSDRTFEWLSTGDTTTNYVGGLYRPDLSNNELYLYHHGRLFKVFGSTSKPDTNLFVYNANNEVL